MASYVLDTTALITVFDGEPGADVVLRALEEAAAEGQEDATEVYVPFMALMELDYITRQRLGAEEARQVCDLVKAWPIELVQSDEAWRWEAARIKATFAVSLADAWICGLATLLGTALVHKDPEYQAVEGLRSLELPYKSTGR